MNGWSRYLSNSDSMLSFHSCMSSSFGSLLNIKTCPEGTVSSSAPNAGLQCVHHVAEKYATKGSPTYMLLSWVLFASSTRTNDGKGVAFSSSGETHPDKAEKNSIRVRSMHFFKIITSELTLSLSLFVN